MNIFNNASTAEWIFNMAFQSLVILLVGWGIVKLFKSKSAPMRSAVVLLTMVLLFILLLMNVSMSSLFKTNLGPTLTVKFEASTNAKTISTPISLLGTSPASQNQNKVLLSDNSSIPNSRSGLDLYWIHFINVFGILWGFGSLLFLLRFIYGAFSLKKLKRGLNPVTNPQIEKVLNELKSVFPRSIQIEIYESVHIKSPLVLGFFKPFILLPSESFIKMQQNDIRSVLTHELSHIYHRDQKIGFLQRFITSLNWWNPLVYTLSSTLSRAREEISDNHVLLKINSKAYAECLVNLAEDKSFLRRFSVANAMASSHIPLKERVKLILSKERNMETRFKKSTIFMLVLVSCVFLALISTYRMTFATEVNENQSSSSIANTTSDQEKADQKTGKIKSTKLVTKVTPIYPEQARKSGIEGTVTLELTVDKKGQVQKVEIRESVPELDDAAFAAVEQWIYEPIIIDNEPRVVTFTVKCKFKLKAKDVKTETNGGVIHRVESNASRKIKEKIYRRVLGGIEGGVTGGVQAGVESSIEKAVIGGVIAGVQSEIEKEALVIEDSKRPRLIIRVAPVYPEEARKEGIYGVVILQVTIDKHGRVERAKIIKSIPALDDAAVKAVYQWEYEPYFIDGKALSVAFNVTIKFNLK